MDNPTKYPPEQLRDVSIPIAEIATRALWAAVILMVAPLLLYVLIHGTPALFIFNTADWLIGAVLLILLTIAHEAVHALGWMLFGGVRAQDIRFGIDRATLSPYAHAGVAMPVTAYRIGAVLPLIVTGIVPYLYGLFAHQGMWAILGAVLISGAVGDLVVLWVIRHIPDDALVLDHPKNAGCYVVENQANASPPTSPLP